MLVRGPGRTRPRTAIVTTLTAAVLAGAAYRLHEAGAFGTGFDRLDTPQTAIRDGHYLVDEDIAPGRYFTPARAAPTRSRTAIESPAPPQTAPLGQITANSYATGPDFARLYDGQGVTFGGDCTWTRRPVS